ncbi:hypothetical protein CFOL_v3_18984 [Cephalotus follicularis]|uniref:Syringolide-induced protein 14-1-1 n=1 Tax=Cephalotus follicularis TaxID=3775 RepID=A0A1Q3C5I9_CEPFO|nr:hypothetical protein CFOL_v3_18984 [Cephalotus follicularis]
MEKQHSQAKPKYKFFKLLRKAASTASFQNHPPLISPSRDKRSSDNTNKIKSHVGIGFSGPMRSIILDEARRNPKNDVFETEEPTSPKVSCMGQIKHKRKIKKAKRVSLPQQVTIKETEPKKKQVSKFKKMFSGAKQGRFSAKSDVNNDKPLSDGAPALSQIKRFASGRDAFAGFDWTAQIAPVESDHRNYHSDEERGDSDREGDEPIIPFSAPIMVGGGVALQPRREVNLWKRRTMNPPRQLKLI